jgi:hypothetical protein
LLAQTLSMVYWNRFLKLLEWHRPSLAVYE